MFEAISNAQTKTMLIPMAPWEVSILDRHMLSYCVSLENTPTQQRGCIVRGKNLSVDDRKKFVRWLSQQNIDVV
eukprot:3803435-Rhodomonas_salina.2